MSDVTEHHVVLDTSFPDQPKWRLVSAVGEIPAELDEIGRPLPAEEGRLILWLTITLDRRITLTPMPSPKGYTVNGVSDDA